MSAGSISMSGSMGSVLSSAMHSTGALTDTAPPPPKTEGSMSGSAGSALLRRSAVSAAASTAVAVRGSKKVSWLDKVSVAVLDATSRVLTDPDPTSAELLDLYPNPYGHQVTQSEATAAVSFNDIVFCTYEAIDAGLSSKTMPRELVAIIKEYSIEIFARIQRNVESVWSWRLNYENALEREDFRGAALGIRHVTCGYEDSYLLQEYSLSDTTNWPSELEEYVRCVGMMKDLLERGKVRAANFLFTQLIARSPRAENYVKDRAWDRGYGKGYFSFTQDFYRTLSTKKMRENRSIYLDGVKILFGSAPCCRASEYLFIDAVQKQDIDVIKMGIQYGVNTYVKPAEIANSALGCIREKNVKMIELLRESGLLLNNDVIQDAFVEALRNRDVPLIQKFIELNVFNNAWMSHQPLLDQIRSVMADGRKDIVSLFPPIAIATVFNNPSFSEALFLFGNSKGRINLDNIMFVLEHLNQSARVKYINHKHLNQTLLSLAVSSSDYEMAKWLFENGASLDLSRDPDKGLLAVAVDKGSAEMVSLLLRNGAGTQAKEKWKDVFSKSFLAENADDRLKYSAMLLSFINHIDPKEKEHMLECMKTLRPLTASGAQDSKSNEA
jgi:hypothetical protein